MWSDTDPAGIVWFGVFCRYFEHAEEDLYRHLMLCYRELGRPAEALRTYRRCRELLSVVLGLQPSAETEAVRVSLDAVGPPGVGTKPAR